MTAQSTICRSVSDDDDDDDHGVGEEKNVIRKEKGKKRLTLN